MTNLPGFHLPRRKKKGTPNGGALFPFYTDYSRATVQAGDTNSPFAQGGPQAQPDASGGSVTEAEGITQDDLIKEPILGSEDPLSGTDEDEPEEEKKEEHTYKFSCAMLNINDSIAQMITYWTRKNIPENCLHIDVDDGMDGYESIIHVTVKYGIISSNPEEISNICSGVGPISLKFGKIEKFDNNENYDVIKIAIEGKKLRELNKLISENTKCEDKFPNYLPHCTLAYVKKGTCDKLVGNTFFDALSDTIDEVYFAAKTGDDYFISLNN